MIGKKEVEKVAKLARLGLTEKEVKKLQKELSKILDYIKKLKEVNISKVEPTSHSIKLENVMREDYCPPASYPKIEEIKKLLNLTPERKESYLKVKSILK